MTYFLVMNGSKITAKRLELNPEAKSLKDKNRSPVEPTSCSFIIFCLLVHYAPL